MEGAPGEKGLKVGAIGLVSAVVIGVASTAPGYSLAASLGFVDRRESAPRRPPSSSSRSSRCCSSRRRTTTSTASIPTAAPPSPGGPGPSAREPAGSAAGRSSSPTSSSCRAWRHHRHLLLPAVRAGTVRRTTSAGCSLVGVIFIFLMTAHLRDRHRAQRPDPVLPARGGARASWCVRRRRAVQGATPATSPVRSTRRCRWLNPFELEDSSALADGLVHRDLPLLGLGHRGHGQRGDQGLPAHARAGPRSSRPSCSSAPT